jgi:hypothetical protein
MDANKKKEMKNIKDTVDTLNRLITKHNKYTDEFTKNLNESFNSIKDVLSFFKNESSTEITLEIKKISNILRSTQLDALSELESEKLLDRISQLNNTSEEPHSDWMDYFTLLKEYMSENGHCYFEKGQRYKGVGLGNWVIKQREDKIPSNDNRKKYLDSLSIRDTCTLNYGRATFEDYRELILNDESENKDSKKQITSEREHKSKFLEYINKDGGTSMDDIDEVKIDTHGGLLNADLVDNYINHTCWSWSNQDATWLRYYKELKKFYIVYGHSVVPATHKINDLNLGTWVLRIRQDYKKGRIETQLDKNTGYSFWTPSTSSFLNRHHLLWNLYFIRETDLTRALTNTDDAVDIMDAGERLKLANVYDISLGGTHE